MATQPRFKQVHRRPHLDGRRPIDRAGGRSTRAAEAPRAPNSALVVGGDESGRAGPAHSAAPAQAQRVSPARALMIEWRPRGNTGRADKQELLFSSDSIGSRVDDSSFCSIAAHCRLRAGHANFDSPLPGRPAGHLGCKRRRSADAPAAVISC